MIDGSGYHHNRCLFYDHSFLFLGVFVVAVGSSIFNSKKQNSKINVVGCNKTI